jgi:hypothetical protein
LLVVVVLVGWHYILHDDLQVCSIDLGRGIHLFFNLDLVSESGSVGNGFWGRLW